MQGAEAILERRDAGRGRLDQQLLFARFFECALPPIDRQHRWQHADTRGQVLGDECPCEGAGVRLRGERGKDDDDRGANGRVHDFFACTFQFGLVLWRAALYFGSEFSVRSSAFEVTSSFNVPSSKFEVTSSFS